MRECEQLPWSLILSIKKEKDLHTYTNSDVVRYVCEKQNQKPNSTRLSDASCTALIASHAFSGRGTLTMMIHRIKVVPSITSSVKGQALSYSVSSNILAYT